MRTKIAPKKYSLAKPKRQGQTKTRVRKHAEENIFDTIEKLGNSIPESIPSRRPKRLSGRDLLALPREQARQLMKHSSVLAAEDYAPGGSLRIFEAHDSIIDP